MSKENSYNLTELIQLSNGNNEFVTNMIEIFIRSSKEMMEQMKSALANKDWVKVGGQAHKAVPSFHFIGLINFAEKLKFIENNVLQSNEHNKISEMIDFIDISLVVILEELNEEIAKYKT